MQESQRRAILKETFNTIADGYDGGALRFFASSAWEMGALLDLRGDESVLDVACGTGHGSVALARLLPRGRVTGVDFSAGMLDQARQKTAALGLGNVEFIERDMTALEFPSATFDVAVCAFGLFFVEDMRTQLAHIASVVKPGGTVMVTGYHEDHYFHPLRELMLARLERYGVAIPPQTWKRIGNERACVALFDEAGLVNARVEARNVGYFLDGAEHWWDVVWNAGFRRLVGQLSPADLDRFKREHLEEVGGLTTTDGLWLDAGVLHTLVTRPA
jgi:ubiquinone/menaquinone biosynthesis C-methylase UbiE